MPNTPTNSFIPKQGPAKKNRQVMTRQVYLLNVISYVLFTASLIATAGIFFYDRYIQSQLDEEVLNLDTKISSFKESDMEQVQTFDLRLRQASAQLEKSISLTSIFTALEAATLQSASIDELLITREADDVTNISGLEEDETIQVSAKISTDNFDSALFQRKVFEGDEVVKAVAIDDLSLEEKLDSEGNQIQRGVSFVARVTVPLKTIPFDPNSEAVLEPTSFESVTPALEVPSTTTLPTLISTTTNQNTI